MATVAWIVAPRPCDDAMRIVRLLLARGADPNKRLETGERVLAKAAAAGDLRVVAMLLDRGARINDGLAAPDDETALETALRDRPSAGPDRPGR